VHTVRRYLHAFRATSTTTPAQATTTPPPPKPRRVARWIMTDPDNLSEENSVRLKEILARCPELDAAAGHVSGFAVMMRELRGGQLEDWMRGVEADDLPARHSFLTGIKRDQDAVVAGLTLPWSSGAVEGAVTLLKRSGYGRAKLDLLRKRVLHAA
jgi:transposase